MDEKKNEEQRPIRKRRGTWDIRPYIGLGLTVIIVFIICLAVFFLVYRYQGLSSGISKAAQSILGVVVGLILAYLLNPIMMFFERRLEWIVARRQVELTHKRKRRIRAASVALAMAVFLAALVALGMLIIPQLVVSIQDLILTMNDKIDTLMSWIDKLTRADGAMSTPIQNLATSLTDYVSTWIEDKFFNSTEFIESISSGVMTAVRGVVAAVIGLIVCVYVLMRKETFIGQAKKLVYAIFPMKGRGIVIDIVHKANEVFGGFFIGKIIDSIIIGVICFVCVTIMKMPYPVLLAVIVGVTNVIPVFGPYIGAIPCLVLVFLVNPIQALYFLIFILILQQIDGNVIGPKILGNSVGLSPFWIIFAVLLFGGCFGVIGMIFGVPIFALIYYIIKRFVEYILEKRKLPQDTKDYMVRGPVKPLETEESADEDEIEPGEDVQDVQEETNQASENIPESDH